VALAALIFVFWGQLTAAAAVLLIVILLLATRSSGPAALPLGG
jgi:hypothetical protein